MGNGPEVTGTGTRGEAVKYRYESYMDVRASLARAREALTDNDKSYAWRTGWAKGIVDILLESLSQIEPEEPDRDAE